jgi:hypothetical protein
MANALACRNPPGDIGEAAGATNHQEAVMHDMVTVDTLRELAAQDERPQVAVLGLGAALLQQQMMILALLAQANEQAQPVVRRR